jgi:hypothetical protein
VRSAPSTDEVFGIAAKLKSAHSMTDIINLFGEPDERYGSVSCDPVKKSVYGLRDVKQSLRYT